MELSAFLSEKMRIRNITIRELSKQSGISIPELKDIISGKRKPRGLTLNKIAGALGCELEELPQ